MNLRTTVRGKVFAAAGIATLVLTAAGASPAQAAGTCTLQQPPPKVRIAAPTTNLTLRIGSDCAAAGVTDASWVASTGGYDEEHFDFVPETSVTWHLGASFNWGYPRNFYWTALGAPPPRATPPPRMSLQTRRPSWGPVRRSTGHARAQKFA